MQGGRFLLERFKNSQSRKSVISTFNGVSMYLTSGNVVKASFLLLFLVSTLTCLISPGSQTGLVSILSLVALIAFEVLEAYKRPVYIDYGADLESLTKKNAELERQFKEIKNDISVASVGNAFNRNK